MTHLFELDDWKDYRVHRIFRWLNFATCHNPLLRKERATWFSLRRTCVIAQILAVPFAAASAVYNVFMLLTTLASPQNTSQIRLSG